MLLAVQVLDDALQLRRQVSLRAVELKWLDVLCEFVDVDVLNVGRRWLPLPLAFLLNFLFDRYQLLLVDSELVL